MTHFQRKEGTSVLLGNHVLDDEIDVALPLAFDPVAFRL
jgi:hypothetical protein